MKLKVIFILIAMILLSSCVTVKHVSPMEREIDKTEEPVTEEVKVEEENLTTGNKISQFSHDHNITEVEVQGIGTDRDSAIRDAQRNAISTAIGTYLVSEQEMQDYMTVKDQILSKSEGFVKAYEVIDQSREVDGSWTVTIKAAVTKDIVMNDLEALGILLAQLDNPSIVVFYAPRGVKYHPRFTEQGINQINQYFTTNRYDVYDLDQLNAMIEDDISMKEIGLNEEVSMAEILAKKLKSDIYVTVALMLEDLGNGKKKAKATAKIFNASTAKLLGVQNGYSDEIYGNSTAQDANIDQAAKKLMPLIMKQVKGYWKLQLDKGKQYVIMFSKLPKGRKVKKAVKD
ncbi:MAG: Dr family adhesin structural subunit, partial [Candidatus Delongbacteria bacterium]|nr:Dr family adhesin structural subunit [Candidatus Delongbacteria bacterium]